VAGNRRQFERALKRADGHAEKREWDKAVDQYQQALDEFPDDVAALAGVGLAYVKTQQLEKALAAYQRARQAGADDARLLERLADVQERLRRLEEAADTYVGLAEHALREREIERAIHAWKRAVQLVPGHPIARLNLAKAHASQGNTRAAIREYLALAEAFQRQKRPDQAMNICQQALMLDPSNAKVLNLMSTLRDLVEPVAAREISRQDQVLDLVVQQVGAALAHRKAPGKSRSLIAHLNAKDKLLYTISLTPAFLPNMPSAAAGPLPPPAAKRAPKPPVQGRTPCS